jgi:putative addiction module component (TIGR02574 family)
MSAQFEEIQRQVKLLPAKEKAALAHALIGELDESTDSVAEQLWLEEAQRRYEAYQRGELKARSGDDVMSAARERLK